MSKKNPFVTYTNEEIFASEAITYIIVAGKDVFDVNGNFFFDKRKAVKYYNKILRELALQLHSGTKAEKKNARIILNNLRVESLRIH